MLTSKQRAYLRSLASEEDTIIQVGKNGINANLVTTVADALAARELIKARVLEMAPLSPREVAEELAAATASEVVQVIGRKFVLYKTAKEPSIVLPR